MIISKLAEMNGIKILKSLGCYSKGVPRECVSGHRSRCVFRLLQWTSRTQLSLYPLRPQRTQTISFLRGLAPALSFTQNPLLWYWQSQAPSCPSHSSLRANSSEMPFLTPAPTQVGLSSWWSPAPSLFPVPGFHQLFSVCSLCLPLGAKLLKPSLSLYHCVSSTEQNGM